MKGQVDGWSDEFLLACLNVSVCVWEVTDWSLDTNKKANY